MGAVDLTGIRTRLAVASGDASKALGEASQIGWLLINDELRGPFTDASITELRERLHVLRCALGDLEQVHADLRDVHSDRGHFPAPMPSPESLAEDPSIYAGRCRRCFRADGLISVRVCTSCTEVRRADDERWIAGIWRGPEARALEVHPSSREG